MNEPLTTTMNDNSIPAVCSVDRYSVTVRGRHVRWASKATFVDGVEVALSELVSKRSAIENALYQRRIHPVY